MDLRAATEARLLVLLALGACRAAATPVPEVPRVQPMLVELYRAFSFDPGEQPDWAAMRALFAEGAVFVAPRPHDASEPPQLDGSAAFLADFQRYAASPELQATGLHERIVGLFVDGYGEIAHAFVAFEGFAPKNPDEPLTRGLDSIELVRDGAGWRVAAFASQYEDGEHPLPRRFHSGL